MDDQNQPGTQPVTMSIDLHDGRPLPLEGGPAPGCALVTLSGELDLGTADRAATPLKVLIDRGASRILVDTGALTFCGAAGLKVFVACRTQLQARGGTFAIVNPSTQVARLLHVTGLSELLGDAPSPPTRADRAPPPSLGISRSRPAQTVSRGTTPGCTDSSRLLR